MGTHNQKGFGALEGVLVLVITVIVGVAIVYVMKANKTIDKTNNASVESSSNTPTKKKVSNTATTTLQSAKPVESKDSGYLVIKEWGVKFKIMDYEKVMYTYAVQNDGSTSVSFAIKPELLQDKSCKLSTGWSRYKSNTSGLGTKVGDYYYESGGSPYNCGNDADNALNKTIRDEITVPVAV